METPEHLVDSRTDAAADSSTLRKLGQMCRTCPSG